MNIFSKIFAKIRGWCQPPPKPADSKPPPSLREGLRDAITGKRKKLSPEEYARLFPVSTQMAAEEAKKEAARQKIAEDMLKNAEIGDLIPTKGVYLGIWKPKDREGKSLGKTFNLFAAPHDLGLDEKGQGKKLIVTYNQAVKHVAEIRNLMGHPGAPYDGDIELYEAIRSGSYKGEWFIPPREILKGTDSDSKKVQDDNLYTYRDQGAFKGTFTGGTMPGLWYWSSTDSWHDSHTAYIAGFADTGAQGWDSKDSMTWATRLVRLEPKL